MPIPGFPFRLAEPGVLPVELLTQQAQAHLEELERNPHPLAGEGSTNGQRLLITGRCYHAVPTPGPLPIGREAAALWLRPSANDRHLSIASERLAGEDRLYSHHGPCRRVAARRTTQLSGGHGRLFERAGQRDRGSAGRGASSPAATGTTPHAGLFASRDGARRSVRSRAPAAGRVDLARRAGASPGDATGHRGARFLGGWRRERMPDALKDETGDVFYAVAPNSVCEVVSPRTEANDRGRKRRIYRREQVGHLWLVIPEAKTLEVYRLEQAGWWKWKRSRGTSRSARSRSMRSSSTSAGSGRRSRGGVLQLRLEEHHPTARPTLVPALERWDRSSSPQRARRGCVSRGGAAGRARRR